MKNETPLELASVSAAEIGSQQFFTGMAEQLVAFLPPFAKFLEWEAGDYLAHEAESANAFFVIQSGIVSIETFEPGRKRLPIQTLGPNDVVGWSWILPPHKWVFDARALSPVSAIAIQAGPLREAMEQNHELGFQITQRLLKVMAARIKSSRLQLLDLFGQSKS